MLEKILGFMVSHMGIEANPKKVWAITEMKSPRTLKEVQSLTGKLVALNRFISKAIDKYRVFFKVIKKKRKMKGESNR